MNLHQSTSIKSLNLPPFLLPILLPLSLNLPAAFKGTALSTCWTRGEWGDDWKGAAYGCKGAPRCLGAPCSLSCQVHLHCSHSDHPGNRAPIDSLATMPVRNVLLNRHWRGRKIHLLEKVAHGSQSPLSLRERQSWKGHPHCMDLRVELCDQRPWGTSREAGETAQSVGPRCPRIKSWPCYLRTRQLRHVSSTS